MNVGQAAVKAIIIISQFFMLETEQMQGSRVKIPDGGRIELSPAAEFVGGAIAGSPLDAGAHHPAGEAVRIVIAAECPGLMCGHAAEFGRPEDQRFI